MNQTFRDMLLFSIGCVIERNCPRLRRILKECAGAGGRAIEHLELSGFEIDESSQMMTRRPPHHGHG